MQYDTAFASNINASIETAYFPYRPCKGEKHFT